MPGRPYTAAPRKNRDAAARKPLPVSCPSNDEKAQNILLVRFTLIIIIGFGANVNKMADIFEKNPKNFRAFRIFRHRTGDDNAVCVASAFIWPPCLCPLPLHARPHGRIYIRKILLAFSAFWRAKSQLHCQKGQK